MRAWNRFIAVSICNRTTSTDTAAYLVRNPLSLKKLVYLDGDK